MCGGVVPPPGPVRAGLPAPAAPLQPPARRPVCRGCGSGVQRHVGHCPVPLCTGPCINAVTRYTPRFCRCLFFLQCNVLPQPRDAEKSRFFCLVMCPSVSLCHSVILSFCHSVILSFCHSVSLSLCLSVSLSLCLCYRSFCHSFSVSFHSSLSLTALPPCHRAVPVCCRGDEQTSDQDGPAKAVHRHHRWHPDWVFPLLWPWRRVCV